MTRDQAQMIVALLQAGWPSRPLPESTVALYVQELQEYDFDRMEKAIRRLVHESKFLPSVAELVEAQPFEYPDSEPLQIEATPERQWTPQELEERRLAAKEAFAQLRKRGFRALADSLEKELATQDD